MQKNALILGFTGIATIATYATGATLTSYSDNFESYSDTAGAAANYNFSNDNNPPTSVSWNLATTGGVGNSKFAARPDFAGTAATLKDSVGSFAFANAGDTITLSDFYKDDGTSPNNGRAVGSIGLLGSDAGFLNSTTSGRIALRVDSDNSVTNGRRVKLIAENTDLLSSLTTTTFDAGSSTSWFRLTLQLTRRVDNKLDYSIAVDGMGSAGTSSATGVFSHTGTTTAVSPLATDSTIYLGLYGRGGGGAGRWAGFDNVSVVSVPEPAAVTLLAAAGVPMLARRRRV